MARRRINLRFLAIAALILFGIVAVAFILQRLLVRESAEMYIQSGKLAVTERRWAEAVTAFSRAAALDRNNPDLLLSVGDVYRQLAVQDPSMAGRDRASYEKALEAHPNYLPALHKLLDSYRDEARLRASAAVFDHIRETASQIAAVDSADLRTKALVPIATIQAYLAGLATGDSTRIDTAVEQVQELMKKDPANADLPFFIARVHIARATEHDQSDRPTEAQRELKLAAEVFDNVLKTQDQNGSMNYRAFQVYSTVSSMEKGGNASQKYGPRIQTAIDRAQLLTKSNDPLYVEINLAAANAARSQQDRPRAEKYLRDLFNQYHEDPFVRLQLAHFLGEDASRREEAIQLLQTRPSEVRDPRYQGATSAILGAIEVEFLMELTNLRIEAYNSNPGDQMQKQSTMSLIEDGYKKVAAKLGEGDQRTMRLRGKMLLTQGRTVEAIQILDQLRNIQQAQQSKDDEMLYLLARAYVMAKQNGPAKELLGQILDRHDNFQPARVLLAQLLLQENSLAAANKEILALERALPGTTEVLHLRISWLDREGRQKNADAIKDTFGRMPEASRSEKLQKAGEALAFGFAGDAQRLLTEVHDLDPGDPMTTGALVQLYVKDNKPEMARAIVAKAMQNNPKSPDLLLLQQKLDNPDIKQLQAVQEKMAESTGDEFTREMRAYYKAREQQDDAGMLAHLNKARQLRPADSQSANLLFQYYVQKQQWDMAEKQLERLSRIDPEPSVALFARYQMAMARKDYSGAVLVGRQVTQIRPQFGQSWLILGAALAAAGQPDEALGSYVAALERQPDSGEAYQGIITCYYALNRSAEARRYIGEARVRFPDDAYFKEQQINYDLNYSNTPETALELRKQLLEANLESPNQWLSMAMAYLRCAQLKGATDAPQANDLLKQGVETIKKAIAKWPDERAFYGALTNAAILSNDLALAEKPLKDLADRPQWQEKSDPWLLLADLYARFGKASEAESSLKIAQSKAPTDVDVQLSLVELLVQQRKLDSALLALMRNEDTPRIQKRRVEILIVMGKLQEAERVVQTALDKKPEKTADLLSLLSLVYLSGGKFDQGLAAAKDALKINPRHPWASYYAGLILLQKRASAEALKYLQIVREQTPNNPDVRLAMYESYLLENDPDNATRELEAALRAAPQNKEIRAKLLDNYMANRPPRSIEALRLLRDARSTPQGRMDPDWINAETMYWIQRRDYDNALSVIQPGLKAAPNNPLLIRTYLTVLLQTGQNELLLKETAPLVQNNKGIWWIYQMRAIARRQMNDTKGALNELDGALADADSNQDAMQSIVQSIASEVGVREALERIMPRAQTDNRWRMIAAYLLHTSQDETQALALIQQVLGDFNQLRPAEQENALRLAGMIFLTFQPKPMYKEAYEIYRKIIEKSPEDITALNNMACILVEIGNTSQTAEAMNISQRAYELMLRSRKKMPVVSDTYGWLLINNGRVDEGIDILRSVVDQTPFLDAHYHLAMAYLKKSFPSEAVKQLTVAQDLIEKAKQAGKPVNPAMQAKVEAAAARAEEMSRKKEAEQPQ